MDIFKVIKKKGHALLMNLAISSFQNRMADQLGVKAGQEMIQGIESAKEAGAELVLADRDIRVTFARIWHNVGFWGKTKAVGGNHLQHFQQGNDYGRRTGTVEKQDTIQYILRE